MEQRKSPTQLKQGLQHAISYVIESKENYVRRPGKDFVRKRKLGVDLNGIEPSTSALRTRRSPK